ncbi:YdcF family protein [Sphingomonas koreensis]|jgi:hypothetical protein|uniref:YdcF family protein n=1 Tax=Sphingomonas koreensis TaxID=93064 RepID=A0AAJ4S379_9SPHN|nr:YdcF family protein [Sphingomonas koreensis]RSU24116.1 YdcF family protein [Sphingomonas koreensis]RSU26366.1 YdcF family protein [Sphingomonas koreensis]RSU33955.1 YdcF family protein [Sphingomonas koreensis]RSU36667.1 YdcF family protein [Sphingomonas koreensis]
MQPDGTEEVKISALIRRPALAVPIGVCVLLAVPAKAEDASVAQGIMTTAPVSDPALVERANFKFALLLDDVALGPVWHQAMQARRARLAQIPTHCAADGGCRLRGFRWTAEEIAQARRALQTAPRTAIAVLAGQMRASGTFARYRLSHDPQLVAQAWDDLTGTYNRIIDVYGLGQAPLYPAIDSISFDAASDLWSKVVVEATNQIAATPSGTAGLLQGDPAHRLALTLLYLNERENAGLFGALDVRENAEVWARARQTDWSRYPYTVILVLGDGPDKPGQMIGTFGKLRLARAVQLYRAGKAPFIVVSGGNVHPAGTLFNEAAEMKRELMTRYAIPADSIVMEPHARHTTTNFRNTARLMIRYGIPLDRPAIATTSERHSAYAGGAEFDRKAMAEIGLVPRRVVKRLSPYDFSFLPEPASTHRDARDPLDP